MKIMTWTVLGAFSFYSFSLKAEEVTPVTTKAPIYIQLEPNVYKRVESLQIDNPPLEIEGERRTLPWAEKTIPAAVPALVKTEREQISIEYSATSFGYQNNLIKSDLQIDGIDAYRLAGDEVKIQVLPLNFTFRYDNNDWGSIANLSLEDTNELSGVWYTRLGDQFKIGIAPQYKYVRTSTKEKELGTVTDRSTSKEHELAIGLYTGFDIIDSENIYFEIANTVSGVYGSGEVENSVELTMYGVRFNPSFNFFYKTKKQFHLGFGMNTDVTFFAGDVKAPGVSKVDISGYIIDLKLELLKMKILF